MFMYMIYLLGTLFRKHYSDIKCFPPGNTTGADTNSHLNGTNPQFRFIVEASKKIIESYVAKCNLPVEETIKSLRGSVPGGQY